MNTDVPSPDNPADDRIGTVRVVDGHIFVKLGQPAAEPWHMAYCQGEQNMSGWQSDECMVGTERVGTYLPVLECGRPEVSSDTQDIEAQLVARSVLWRRVASELESMPSEFIHPDEFGGYDVDYSRAAEIAMAVVEPVLSELRAGFAQSARRSVAIQRDLDETLSKLSAVRVEQHDLRAANDQVLAENRRLASDNVALRNAVRWSERDIAALTARMGAVNTIPDDALAQIQAAVKEPFWDAASVLAVVKSWQGSAVTNPTDGADDLQASSNLLQGLEQPPVDHPFVQAETCGDCGGERAAHKSERMTVSYAPQYIAEAIERVAECYRDVVAGGGLDQHNAGWINGRSLLWQDVLCLVDVGRAVVDFVDPAVPDGDLAVVDGVEMHPDGRPVDPEDARCSNPPSISCADAGCPEHGDPDGADDSERQRAEDAADARYQSEWMPKGPLVPPPTIAGETWSEGDIAYDKTRFVWVRYEQGWRTYPRTTGVQYGDTLLEAQGGPLVRLSKVPTGTDTLGMLPSDFPTPSPPVAVQDDTPPPGGQS